MKVLMTSRFIARLQALIDDHGDLPIYVHDDGARGEYAEIWAQPYPELIREYQPADGIVGRNPSLGHPAPPFIQL